jgi:hypothetical protein
VVLVVSTAFRRKLLHCFICIRQITWKILDKNFTATQLFTNSKKAYGSVKREALYNILMEFDIPENKLIKMCLN